MHRDGNANDGAAVRARLRAVTACVIAALLVVCFMVAYFPATQVAERESALAARAESYELIAARELRGALATGDSQNARDVFDALGRDPLVVSLALYRPDGTLALSRGDAAPRWTGGGAGQVRAERVGGHVRVAGPVEAGDGATGTIVLEISRGMVVAHARSLRRVAGGVALLALVIAAAVGWSASTSRRLMRVLSSRTAALDRSNRQMRMVFDAVGQGFVTVDASGAMSSQRSAAVERWLGPVAASASFADYLRRVDPRAAAWVELGWQALADGELPVEVALEQLPRRITHRGAHYSLTYRPMSLGPRGEPREVLVVITDVTADVARERAESREREMVRVLEAALRDRAGFLDFLAEGSALVRRATDPTLDRDETFRAWHTLKGNCALYGLGGLVAACHDVEARMADEDSGPTADERARLVSAWASFEEAARPVLAPEGGSRKVEVEAAEHGALLEAVYDGAPRAVIARRLESWAHESVQKRLERFAAHARTLATRLEKPGLEVRVEAPAVRAPREAFAPFWAAFVHAIRNAVDHGIEAPEDRVRAGKSAAGLLTLRAREVGSCLEVELSDDGGGIDWEAVGALAAATRMPHKSREDLIEALFAVRMSTREEVTDVSGRGVGLGALRAACVKLGGSIDVESEPGRGTTLRARLPLFVTTAVPQDDAVPVTIRAQTRASSAVIT